MSEAAELAELQAEVDALKAKMETVLLMLATDKPETVKQVDRITDAVNLQF